ncbi:MAG: glycosyltransferase family 4 protein [Alphaproteobacteria bacterium]
MTSPKSPPDEVRLRLAFIIQHPIHYHAPLWRAVAADPDIDSIVHYMQRAWSESGYDPEVARVVDWGVPMLEGYRWRVWRNISPMRNGVGFWKFINPGLIWHVLTGPYDAVYVHGCNHFSHVMAMLAGRLSGKRVIFRTDTYNLGERSVWRALLRELSYALILRLPSVCLVVGHHNRRFYASAGVADGQMVYAPQVVDNDYFTAAARRLVPQRDALKAGFAIAPESKILLWSAKFQAKKQPLLLLDAFARTTAAGPWTLLMAGDGELLEAAKARAVTLGIQDRVVFTGFLDQQRIVEAYAVADLFVLPSGWQETWGLVVNEAMNFSLPVVVSDRVGAAPDLVAGRAGLVFRHDDGDDLVAKLEQMMGDAALRRRFAESGRKTIEAWSVPAYVAGLRRALGLGRSRLDP